jgi:hypothetical protein
MTPKPKQTKVHIASEVIDEETAFKDNKKALVAYLKKAKALPEIVNEEISDKCERQAWEDYLKSLDNLGAEDPSRVPSYEFLHKKCTI